jgi:tol-pal system protein YbgF
MNGWRGSIGSVVVTVGVMAGVVGCAGLTIPKKETVAVEPEIATLKGVVEDLKRNQEAATQELAKMVLDLKTVQKLLSQMANAQGERDESLRTVKAAVDRLAGRVEKLPDASAPAPTPQGRSRAVPASPEELYNSALSSYRARDLNAAVLKLFSFVDSFPTHRLAESAQFMLADVYYAQGEYELASEEFLKLLDAHPRGAKVPDALLKLGLCYRALRDPAEARTAWRRLVREFPKSDAASRARSLLAEGSRKGR